MGHPLPASHQGHQKARGQYMHLYSQLSISISGSTTFLWLIKLATVVFFFSSTSVSLYFSPGLSNPQVLRHLGNFLCFQGNPIRILLTGKSNKNSIYTRASKIWSNELKTCQFSKEPTLARRVCHKRAWDLNISWNQMLIWWSWEILHLQLDYQVSLKSKPNAFFGVKSPDNFLSHWSFLGAPVSCSFLWERNNFFIRFL